MSSIPKNIFFYWDNNVPQAVVDNVNYYRIHNPEYNVFLLNDSDIDKYQDEYPQLVKLFHLSTIAAFKSDIIRIIFLYQEGGIWIDTSTILYNPHGIKILFEKSKDYNAVITLFVKNRSDLSTGVLISKPKSKLFHDNLQLMTKNILEHYEIEKHNDNYIPYNFFTFVAPVTFYELLDYKNDTDFRNNVLDTQKYLNQDVFTLDTEKFKYYNCALMIVEDYVKFYGCNVSHNHNENFHKHWSNLQKVQKLFRKE
jgi:hypothetical protein